MSGVANPPHKEDEQEQNNTNMLLFVLFFMLTARILTKKAKILLKFPPPEALFFEQFNFYAYLCALKILRRFAHIGNRVFRKRNDYVFIATANQTKTIEKNTLQFFSYQDNSIDVTIDTFE